MYDRRDESPGVIETLTAHSTRRRPGEDELATLTCYGERGGCTRGESESRENVGELHCNCKESFGRDYGRDLKWSYLCCYYGCFYDGWTYL